MAPSATPPPPAAAAHAAGSTSPRPARSSSRTVLLVLGSRRSPPRGRAPTFVRGCATGTACANAAQLERRLVEHRRHRRLLDARPTSPRPGRRRLRLPLVAVGRLAATPTPQNPASSRNPRGPAPPRWASPSEFQRVTATPAPQSPSARAATPRTRFTTKRPASRPPQRRPVYASRWGGQIVALAPQNRPSTPDPRRRQGLDRSCSRVRAGDVARQPRGLVARSHLDEPVDHPTVVNGFYRSIHWRPDEVLGSPATLTRRHVPARSTRRPRSPRHDTVRCARADLRRRPGDRAYRRHSQLLPPTRSRRSEGPRSGRPRRCSPPPAAVRLARDEDERLKNPPRCTPSLVYDAR